MLNITDEFSPLTDVCVCFGESLPEYNTYTNDHPEFTKYRTAPWDKKQMIEQQQRFFNILQKYSVSLHFIEPDPKLFWQMYTRDTGFVINNTLYYCADRGLPSRRGEIEAALKSLSSIVGDNVIEITEGRIEGGDVLIDQGMAYVGLSARTTPEAVDSLRQYVEVITLELGTDVMHLDTRMTILPNRNLLIFPPAFTEKGLQHLRQHFNFIEVTEQECETLGTNVFVINPETIVVNQSHRRVIKKLTELGFHIEATDYSQPIAITGSFRCTTLPLARR